MIAEGEGGWNKKDDSKKRGNPKQDKVYFVLYIGPWRDNGLK